MISNLGLHSLSLVKTQFKAALGNMGEGRVHSIHTHTSASSPRKESNAFDQLLSTNPSHVKLHRRGVKIAIKRKFKRNCTT